MALERELATYHARLPDLLADAGRFVVVHADEVAGTWDTYDDALKAGYERYGLEPFMVKQVLAIEPDHFFTHELP